MLGLSIATALALALADRASASAADRPPPTVESAECGFWVPPDERATCLYLVVPERRDDEAQATPIRVFAAILHSTADRPAPDPVIYLSGGPGDGNFIDDVGEYWWETSAPFRRQRDFIVLDQRGIGRSWPSLDCPEMEATAARFAGTPVIREDARRRDIEAMLACRDRLLAEGIDLAGYTSPEIARDVVDLATALRLPSVNLLATSFGTRVALIALRDAPERFRSAVLDGPFPPDASDYADRPRLTERVFRQLFEDCAADAACGRAFPDLEGQLQALVERLDAEPVVLGGEGMGARRPVHVDGGTVIEALFNAFYDAFAVPEMPAAIARAARGDFGLLRQWAGSPFAGDPYVAEGMAYALKCRELVPFADPVAFTAAVRAHQPYGALAERLLEWHLCPYWNARPIDPYERRPTVSDVPTLLLTGTYDPVTPPEWAYQAAGGLRRSVVLELRGASHAVLGSEPCTVELVEAFLADPEAGDLGRFCTGRTQPPRFFTR